MILIKKNLYNAREKKNEFEIGLSTGKSITFNVYDDETMTVLHEAKSLSISDNAISIETPEAQFMIIFSQITFIEVRNNTIPF